MSLDITVTDQFCGAGGSSQGAKKAGARIVMAANHWRLAVDTHNTNFPDTEHDCADVSQVNPRRWPTTDILITSPECTNHSNAKSNRRTTESGVPRKRYDRGDPNERSRATMWDVPRFAEFHRYRYIIVENVVEAAKWGVGDNGVLFQSWLSTMHAMGYKHKIVYLNSAFTGEMGWWSDPSKRQPAPQLRNRMYVHFWLDGQKEPDLDFRPPCWCSQCERIVEGYQWFKPVSKAVSRFTGGQPWGTYRAQYVYRCSTCRTVAEPIVMPAAWALDWSIPAVRIGDRELVGMDKLADSTIARIRKGLEKFGNRAALMQTAGHTYERPGYVRAWPADVHPFRTQMTDLLHGLYSPFVTQLAHEGISKSANGPVMAQTARASMALTVPPFITEMYGTAIGRTVNGPLTTMTANGNHHGVVVPAGGTWEERATGCDEPFRTIVTREAFGVAEMPEGFIVRNYGGEHQAAQHSKPLDAPLSAVTAVDHHSLVTHQAMLTSYYGKGGSSTVAEPCGTVTTKDRHALVEIDRRVDVEDCTFRMLEPHEVIHGAMAFDRGYVVLGNKRERVAQGGNAVTPPAMELQTTAAIKSLAP